tara:strand:+ start:307 stop:582 length:276 start_codon:yes stop_codon:yes gene_type:complete
MKYAIEVLEKDKELLKRCLSNWEINQYPEAKKERINKLQDLNNAINFLDLKPIINIKKLLFDFEEFYNINNCEGSDFSKVVDNFIKKYVLF